MGKIDYSVPVTEETIDHHGNDIINKTFFHYQNTRCKTGVKIT